MSEQNSLMNIGDLAKPATTLIEKIADATGAVFLPHQIKRVAKAEAEAAKIKALAEIEVTEIQRRALVWSLGEQTKFQENRESVLLGAIPKLKEDAKPEEIENDWLANFFDKCKLISDEEMQSLWSKILAEEANKKGSFSKRTVEIVSAFDKQDAQSFTNLCSFGWQINQSDDFTPLIYYSGLQNDIYSHKDITFGVLSHLEDIGLIKFDTVQGFVFNSMPKNIKASYYDTQINLEFKKAGGNEMDIGNILLSRTGYELAKISGSGKVEGFLEFAIQRWENLGYIASKIE